MNKNRVFLLALIGASLFLSSCASIALARLPSNDKIFISQASENGFVAAGKLDYPYQPIGYINVEQSHLLAPGKDELEVKYGALEKTLVKELTKTALAKWGIDAIINLKWEVIPGLFTTVRITGLAVKRKE
jgi:hypothetical protein